MPINPRNSEAIVRPDLAAVAVEFDEERDRRGYIGSRVLPWCPVATKTGQYPLIPLKAFLSLPDTRRMPDGNYRRDGFEYDKLAYACEENGWEIPLGDDTVADLSRLFDLEATATRRCMRIIERSQEYRIARLIQNEAAMEAITVDTPWTSIESVDPLEQIQAAISDMRSEGIEPNALILTTAQYELLGRCKSILDRIKYRLDAVGEGILPVPVLANYFKLDILVAGGMYDSAPKGAEVSAQGIWSDSYAALAMLVPEGQASDLEAPGLGRTLLWTEDSPEAVVVEEYRDEKVRGQVIRARQNTAEVIQQARACRLLKNVIVES